MELLFVSQRFCGAWRCLKVMAGGKAEAGFGKLLGVFLKLAAGKGHSRLPLTRQANYQAFYGAQAFPDGPYKIIQAEKR